MQSRIFSYFSLLPVVLLLLSCAKDSTVDIQRPTLVTGDIWKNTSQFQVQDRSDELYMILQYLVFSSDTSCNLLYTTGLGFNWVHAASYRVQGSDVVITIPAFTGSMVATFNDDFTVLSLNGTTFRKSSDSLIVGHWIHAVTITLAFAIPDTFRDFSNFYYGLAFDGQSFYSVTPNSVINFSDRGIIIRKVPLPSPDSLSNGFTPYPTSLDYADGHLWISMICNSRCQRIYKINPVDFRVVDSKVLQLTERKINSFAKAEGNPFAWVIANGWSGDGTMWLHKVNVNTGQEADLGYPTRRDPYALNWHKGLLWAHRFLSSPYKLSEVMYLQAFDPETGRGVHSVKLIGFPNRNAYPYYPNINGITFVGDDVFLLEGYEHVVWKGTMPRL